MHFCFCYFSFHDNLLFLSLSAKHHQSVLYGEFPLDLLFVLFFTYPIIFSSSLSCKLHTTTKDIRRLYPKYKGSLLFKERQSPRTTTTRKPNPRSGVVVSQFIRRRQCYLSFPIGMHDLVLHFHHHLLVVSKLHTCMFPFFLYL